MFSCLLRHLVESVVSNKYWEISLITAACLLWNINCFVDPPPLFKRFCIPREKVTELFLILLGEFPLGWPQLLQENGFEQISGWCLKSIYIAESSLETGIEREKLASYHLHSLP